MCGDGFCGHIEKRKAQKALGGCLLSTRARDASGLRRAMKNLAISLALGVMLLASVSLGQDTTSSGKSKSRDRTITGCLQTRGSGPDKFVLMGNDGSTWDVKSDSVVLADHVGHTITATGTVSNVTMHNAKEKAKDEAASAGMMKTNDEHGDMEVSSVTMVSKSCK